MTRVSGRQEQQELSPASKTSTSSLIELAIVGDLRGIRKRLRNSIFKKADDLNHTDSNNNSALHHAIKHNHQHVVHFLVQRGADVKAIDNNGWNSLHFAVRFASSALLEELLSLEEVDVDIVDKRGWSPLHMAARNGQSSKARLLLEHGANVDLRQNQGWNALHLAVRYGQPDTISILLEYGVDIDAENRGWTPLHLAALNGHTDIASMLLNKNANTDRCNADNHTALDIARREKHERIVAMILEREFQSNLNLFLPSPPPTPLRDTRPSAPSLDDLIDDQNSNNNNNNGSTDNFDHWCRSLEKRVQAMASDPYEEVDEENDENNNESSHLDECEADYASPVDDLAHFAWKSLEEEAKVLSDQLRKLRSQEVARLKRDIKRIKAAHAQRIANIDSGQQRLREELSRLRSASPQLSREQQEQEADIGRRRLEINALIQTSKHQAELIRQLSLHQSISSYSRASENKKRIVEELEEAQKTEMRELEQALVDLEAELQLLQSSVSEKRAVADRKKEVLESHLEQLEEQRGRSCAEMESRLKISLELLEKAERKKHLFDAELNAEHQDQNWFGCPICLEVLKPPTKIFQCPEGHILCEECKENPALVHCPQCRCSLEGQCSRNRALEEVARSYFPLAPSETL